MDDLEALAKQLRLVWMIQINIVPWEQVPESDKNRFRRQAALAQAIHAERDEEIRERCDAIICTSDLAYTKFAAGDIKKLLTPKEPQ